MTAPDGGPPGGGGQDDVPPSGTRRKMAPVVRAIRLLEQEGDDEAVEALLRFVSDRARARWAARNAAERGSR